MSHSERFSWMKPWRTVWVLMALVAVLIVPAGLHFWRAQAVNKLIDAVESGDIPATEHALKTVKELKTTDLALPRLLELLESDSKSSNTFAFLHALSGIGPPAISALRDVVESSDDTDFRIRAIGILSMMMMERLGGTREDVRKAIPTLLRALRDENKSVRFDAAYAISRIDQTQARETLPTLLIFLKDDDRYVRSDAAHAIGNFGKYAEDALPNLLEALNDPELVVRATAVVAIGNVGIPSKNAIDALIEVLFDEQAVNYRWRAANSLGQFGSGAQSAVPALLEALKRLQNEEDDSVARSVVISALGDIGHFTPEVIQALIDALNDTRFNYCQKAAAVALGKFGPKAIKAVPDLIRASHDYEDELEDRDLHTKLSTDAVNALEKIDPPTARRIKNESVVEDQEVELQ